MLEGSDDCPRRSQYALAMAKRTISQERWSRTANAFVPQTRDPASVRLERFDPMANRTPSPSTRRDTLLAIAEAEARCGAVEVGEWPPISLPVGDATIDLWTHRAIFHTWNDQDGLTTLFRIAAAADLTTILPRTLVLTVRSQKDRVPDRWRDRFEIALAEDAAVFAARVAAELFAVSPDDYAYDWRRDPDRGLFPARSPTLYVETTDGDDGATMQTAFASAFADAAPSDRVAQLRPLAVRLTLPDGDRFAAFSWTGKAALDTAVSVAAAQGRACGEFVNFERFAHFGRERDEPHDWPHAAECRFDD